MNVSELCKFIFPSVKFTGGSKIHASYAQGFSVPFSIKHKSAIIKQIVDSHFTYYVWKITHDNFGKMGFLIDYHDFKALAYTELGRYLDGMGAASGVDKLKNPVTKNTFHRIALFKKLVGGIRFWVTNCDDGTSEVGFRFRIEVLKETPEQTRTNIRAECDIAQKEQEQMFNTLEIPEPYNEEQEQVRHRVKNGDN